MPFRSWVRTCGFSAVVLLVQPGFCQTKGGVGTTGATGTTGTSGATGTTGTTSTGTGGSLGNTGASTTTSNSAPPPIPVLITGRVLLEDGTPPTEPASIERVCIGVTRNEGYTDSHGYFAVSLGDEKGVFQDSSEDTERPMRTLGSISGSGSSTSSGMGSGISGDRRFSNCDIRAKLSGYRSQSISLTTHRAMDNPDIGVIVLQRMGKDEGTTVSMVSLAAPKEARKAFEKGLALMAGKKNNVPEAEKEFQRAIDLYPKYAAAWTELGKIQAGRNELVDARRSFDQAMQADPKFLGPFLQISLLAMQARKWQELVDVTDRAIQLDPYEYPQIYLFNAVANYDLKHFETAERSIEAAAKLDTLQQIAEIPHLQGLLLVQRHEYPAAAERLRTYLKMAPDAEDAALVRTQLAQVDKAVAQNTTTTVGPKQ
jgi:hypothetical protein